MPYVNESPSGSSPEAVNVKGVLRGIVYSGPASTAGASFPVIVGAAHVFPNPAVVYAPISAMLMAWK